MGKGGFGVGGLAVVDFLLQAADLILQFLTVADVLFQIADFCFVFGNGTVFPGDLVLQLFGVALGIADVGGVDIQDRGDLVVGDSFHQFL